MGRTCPEDRARSPKTRPGVTLCPSLGAGSHCVLRTVERAAPFEVGDNVFGSDRASAVSSIGGLQPEPQVRAGRYREERRPAPPLRRGQDPGLAQCRTPQVGPAQHSRDGAEERRCRRAHRLRLVHQGLSAHGPERLMGHQATSAAAREGMSSLTRLRHPRCARRRLRLPPKGRRHPGRRGRCERPWRTPTGRPGPARPGQR